MSAYAKLPGCIHPQEGPGGKAVSKEISITDAPLPSRVAIPLSQHIGAPCKPIVEVGDFVKVGQMIGEPVGGMSAAVHASISGTVRSIEKTIIANGTEQLAVVIDRDTGDEKVEFTPVNHPESLSKQELCDLCRNMGIVGMGGATFPTAVKLNVQEGKKVDTLILNGAECEPYLSADHRLMLEYTEQIVKGAALIQNALQIDRVMIGIEKNKPDAIQAMRNACSGMNGFEVCPLDVRYPQGGEKQLIYALTRKVVPMGGLPLQVGCIVENVGTCNAIYEAAYLGKPLYERVITVGGCIHEPANYKVRIGAPVEWVIDSSEGFTAEARMLIYGGPMMGQAISRQDIPITKGCSGITVLERTQAVEPETACIRCGRCLQACPMKLQPTMIDRAVRKGFFDQAEELNAMNCLECGACTWSCPAKRNLTQSCKVAKRIITQRRKEAQAKKGGQ